MVLHGEDGLGLVGKTFQRAVVQVYVRDDHIGNVVDIHTETVVLGRDFHMPGREVFNRVVTAVVAEFQLAGRAAQSVAEKLMAEADARHGIAFDELLDGHDFVGEGRGVAGAVGQEHGLSAAGLDLFGGEGRRNDQHVEALLGQKAQDVPLDAEVVGDEARAFARPVVGAVGVEFGGDAAVAGPLPRRSGHHAGDEVLAFHRRQGLRLHDEFGGIGDGGGNHAAHGSVHTQVAGQGAGVDALDAGNAVLLQKVGQGTHGAPVGGRLAALLDDEGRGVDLAGLHVFGIDPVVADQGPRHAHHLAVIGGIGKNLLIPGHAGVENDFPAALAGAGKGTSFKYKTVFKSQ